MLGSIVTAIAQSGLRVTHLIEAGREREDGAAGGLSGTVHGAGGEGELRGGRRGGFGEIGFSSRSRVQWRRRG